MPRTRRTPPPHARASALLRRLRTTAPLAAALAATACADSVTNPARDPVPLRASTSETVIGSFPIPIGATSNDDGLDWTNTGIKVPRTGTYRLRVSGVITVTENPRYREICPGAPPLDYSWTGDWGPSGYKVDQSKWTSALRVQLTDDPRKAAYPAFPFTVVNPTTTDVERTLQAGTEIYVSRDILTGISICHGQPAVGMWALSSSQVLTVTEIPDASLDCVGPDGATAVERGATVRCVFSSRKAFTVVSRRSTGTGFTVADAPNAVQGAGTQHVWEGPAVTDTHVEMVVSSEGETSTYSADFTVKPRDWPKLSLGEPVETVNLRGRLQAYPGNGILGNASSVLPPVATLPVTRATAGPNTGLSFLTGPLPPFGFSIYVHPGLMSSATGDAKVWRDDQDGHPDDTCTSSVFSTLLREVRRHEGMTKASNSHYGVARKHYTESDAEQQFEALWSNGDESSLRARVRTQFGTLHNTGPLKEAQARFDRNDYPLIDEKLGCVMDYNRNDG